MNLISDFFLFPKVDAADPAFPRNAGHWWFGCKTTGALGNLENEVDGVEQSQPGGLHLQSNSDTILDAGEWCFKNSCRFLNILK